MSGIRVTLFHNRMNRVFTWACAACGAFNMDETADGKHLCYKCGADSLEALNTNDKEPNE